MEINNIEEKIYWQYQNIIAPFIAELEVRDNEYPIEIFNEIRSIFTHLSRYKLQKGDKDISAAESHSKRAILDCYKYLCISMEEKVSGFRNEYKDIDLGLADNGKFLPELNRLELKAKNAFKVAKEAEVKNEIDEDERYKLFESAYNEYSEMDKFLDDSQEAILFASTHSKRSNKITIVSCIITVISIIVAIISFFF
ncbi:MAG: hypothetical protein NC086_08655 [Alistipes sp.]|nr:hypothetical protein [Alistipes sp.]